MSESLEEAVVRLERFTSALGAPYALIGGGAIVARVRVRATDDLDLIVATRPEALDRLLEVAVAHGYRYSEADREIFLEGLIRLSSADGGGVDVIAADSPYLAQVIARATPVDLGVATVCCATVEDLVLLKLEANRPIDIDDVLAIKDTFRDALDMDYMRREAAALGLGDRLALYFDER